MAVGKKWREIFDAEGEFLAYLSTCPDQAWTGMKGTSGYP